MTKEEIVHRVWEKVDLNKKDAARAVAEVLDCIKTTLARGEKVKIGGFGTFEVRERKARIGRNPKTGEEAMITAGKTVKFKAGKPLKARIANS
jgi:DNA-binding protein HU-beta